MVFDYRWSGLSRDDLKNVKVWYFDEAAREWKIAAETKDITVGETTISFQASHWTTFAWSWGW
jgi:hypothetical protein